MTNGEKGQFCAFAAALLAPPDAALVDDLQQDALHARLDAYTEAWGGDRDLLSAFSAGQSMDDLLSVLQREYTRLFDRHEGERISLVESTYKPWTSDKECGMVFAGSIGLLMGDCAVHLLEIYQQLSLEVPEEFRSMPDHLVLELEFLALLYQLAPEEIGSRSAHCQLLPTPAVIPANAGIQKQDWMPDQVRHDAQYPATCEGAAYQFISDHLDWIPALKKEMERANPHPFYRNAIDLVRLFLQNELKNGKVKAHGEKTIH